MFALREALLKTRHIMFLQHLFLFVLLIAPVYSHMTMSEPPPINHRKNPFFQESNADYDYSAPLSPSGSNYPCRGHLKSLGSAAGGSVRNYRPGGTYQFVIDGQATHAGGSCQASLSFDGGNSWKVIKSYIGDCVRAQPGGDQSFRFTIPGNTPTGQAIFAWTWFNNLGNREMYMNCAVVTITNSARKRDSIDTPAPLEPLEHEKRLHKRAIGNTPIFLANIGNGCTTPAGTDVVFPNPGDDVEFAGNAGARASPSGACGSGNYQGGGAVGNGGTSGGDGPVVTIPSSPNGPEIQVGPYVGIPGPGPSDPSIPTDDNTGTGTGDAEEIARIDELRRLSGKHRNDCSFWISQGFVCSAGEKSFTTDGITAILAIFGTFVMIAGLVA